MCEATCEAVCVSSLITKVGFTSISSAVELSKFYTQQTSLQHT